MVTLPLLLEAAPAGTVDPTPFLYDSTMLAAACIIGGAGCGAGLVYSQMWRSFPMVIPL